MYKCRTFFVRALARIKFNDVTAATIIIVRKVEKKNVSYLSVDVD